MPAIPGTSLNISLADILPTPIVWIFFISFLLKSTVKVIAPFLPARRLEGVRDVLNEIVETLDSAKANYLSLTCATSLQRHLLEYVSYITIITMTQTKCRIDFQYTTCKRKYHSLCSNPWRYYLSRAVQLMTAIRQCDRRARELLLQVTVSQPANCAIRF